MNTLLLDSQPNLLNVAGLKNPDNAWVVWWYKPEEENGNAFEGGNLDGAVFLLSSEQDQKVLAEIEGKLQEQIQANETAAYKQTGNTLVARFVVAGGEQALWITGDSAAEGSDLPLANFMAEHSLDCATAIAHLDVFDEDCQEEMGEILIDACKAIRASRRKPKAPK